MENLFISENGVSIYSYPNTKLHSFCLCLYVKGGCLYESDEDSGITHFFEHISFRNIDKALNGELAEILDKYGLYFNASTYKEFVQFIITGAVEYYEKAVDVLLKVFTPLALNSKEIDTERKIIKAEIREEDEKNGIDFYSDSIVWENTALKNMITGTSKTLDRIGKTKLLSAQLELLTKENIFFYLTGNIKKKEIEYLAKELNKCDVKASSVIKNNTAQIPNNFMRRNAAVYIKKSDYNFVRFSFDFKTEEFTDAQLNLLFDILFRNNSSLINQTLCEKSGYIYSFDSSVAQFNNIGNMFFSYEIQQQNILPSIEKIVCVLNQLKTECKKELSFAKPPYIINAGMRLDETENLNWIMAYENHIFEAGNFKTIEERKQKYKEVTNQKICELAEKIFTINNVVVTLKTNSKASAENIKKIILKLGE